MDIIEYLSETEYAVENILNLILHNRKILAQYESGLRKLEVQLSDKEVLYRDFLSKDISDDFSDAQVMQAYQRYYIYEQKNIDKEQLITEINNLQKTIKTTHSQLAARDFSIKSLCGAVLQIAKQGLSICYGKEENCVKVRTIAGERLSNIIFQARNQSMHFEENSKNKVICCFSNLEQKFGKKISISQQPNINLSDVIVIDVLGWNSYESFYTDMVAFKKKF